jgi:hypothetical protein
LRHGAASVGLRSPSSRSSRVFITVSNS